MKARAYLSEFIGTFALLFIGIGAAASGDFIPKAGAGLLGIALAHGLAIAAVASAVGPISGGHFNPAVTLGAFVGKRIGVSDALAYILCQCAGALAAVWMLLQAMPAAAMEGINNGIPAFGQRVDSTKALILEAIATFFLVFVVYGTAFYRRAPKMGALFIGLSITMAILAIGPITGAALNPARWFGPALFNGAIDGTQTLVYVGGPILGGLVAGIVFAYFLEKEPEAMEGTGGPAEDSAAA